MRLNVGCGRQILDGFENLDRHPAPGITVCELDHPDKVALPYPDDSVSEIYASHVLEHIRHPLPLMQELWRVAEPAATLIARCPYGSSDDADEDPTHARRMFLGSWGYFSQPFYWRADYGYAGDWQPTRVVLRIAEPFCRFTDDEISMLVRHQRNVVTEMVATLTAVKPARPPDRDRQEPSDLVIERVKDQPCPEP